MAGALVVALLLLSGCSFVGNGLEPELHGAAAWREIRRQLNNQLANPTATVRLSKVPGKWSRVILVCRGVTRAQLSQSLGFPWTGPSPDSAAYGYLVFATKTSVEQYYLGRSDQDENFVDHWTFSVCPVIAGFEVSAPIELMRNGDPSIEFKKYEATNPKRETWWEVTPAELDALESQSGHDG